jgi:nitrite reductase (NO-forming)
MYHCGTMPMTAHIANGMAGAVVIEPDDLPAVDKSYLLVQSELYLGSQGGPVDVDKALGGDSNLDIVAFNGYANQYVAQPLSATVGERVRIWTLDVGPSRASSFHIVGGQFDRVWFEGGG